MLELTPVAKLTVYTEVLTRQGNNLLVIEAHSVEDVPDVRGALDSIRQAAVLRAGCMVNFVTSARLPVDDRAYTQAQ